jgi:hypothetical protein
MIHRRAAMARIGSVGAAALFPQVLAAGTASAKEVGWQPLFNGNDLDGWTFFHDKVGDRDVHNVASIDDGVLHFLGPKFDRSQPSTMGHIATVEEWGNYHLRLEFKWGTERFAPRTLQRRNSGILYHMAPDKDRLFPDCVEFQVEEGDVGDAVMVNTQGLQGPVFGGTPLWPNWIPAIPKVYEEPLVVGSLARQWFRRSGVYEELDEWNTLDLYAFDDQAAHLVNGRIVLTLFSMISRAAGGSAAKSLTKGRIALEFEAAEVFFRNVAIKPLDESAIAQLKRG